MIYAQKDGNGILSKTIFSETALSSPWIEVTQESVYIGMVWNESTQEFDAPPEE